MNTCSMILKLMYAVAVLSVLCGCATNPYKTLFMKQAELLDSEVVQVNSNSPPIRYTGKARLERGQAKSACLAVEMREVVTEYVIFRNRYVNQGFWCGVENTWNEPGERQTTRLANNVSLVCVATVNDRQHTTTNWNAGGNIALPLEKLLGDLIDENTKVQQVYFQITAVGDTASCALMPVVAYDKKAIDDIFSDYLIGKNNKGEAGRRAYRTALLNLTHDLNEAISALKRGVASGHDESAELLELIKYTTDNIQLYSVMADFTIQRKLDGDDFPELKTSPFPFDVHRKREEMVWNLYQVINPNGRMFMLRTYIAEYVSTGAVTLTVKPSVMVDVKMESGFTKDILVVDEVSINNIQEKQYAKKTQAGFMKIYGEDQVYVDRIIGLVVLQHAKTMNDVKILTFFNQFDIH